MDNDDVLQLMSDIVVSSIILKLKQFNTNAKVGEVYEDEGLYKIRRTGIYGWVEAEDGREYGDFISVPQTVVKFDSVQEFKDYAKQVEKQLNDTLSGVINPRFVTKEDIAKVRKEIDAV